MASHCHGNNLFLRNLQCDSFLVSPVGLIYSSADTGTSTKDDNAHCRARRRNLSSQRRQVYN